MTRSRLFLCFIALLGGCITAQVPPVNIQPRMSIVETRPAAQIRVNSDLVLVPVLVTDISDRAVVGLAKRDFRVFDDKIEQQISHFSVEDAPVSIVLVFDTSGSMGKKLRTSRIAVGEFLREANPEDEFALIEFADRPRIAAAFTQDTEKIQTRLASLESNGRTALIDAVFLALDQLKHARHARKAVVIISDGGDNSSRYGPRDLERKVREADAQIFSIGIVDSVLSRGSTPEELEGPSLLTRIAGLSGGRYFESDHLGSLTETAKRIGTALRHQYVLGYSPSVLRHDGKYHRILVKVPPVKGQGKLRASFRTSYLAPEH